MATAFKLIGIIMGFAFPVFLVKALRANREDGGRVTRYTVLSSVSFGFIVFTVMGLLPN